MDPVYEIQKMQDSGIRFSVERATTGQISITLGDYREPPLALAVVNNFDEAADWLREQVKIRFPESAYAKRLLIN